jgi:endonuclease III
MNKINKLIAEFPPCSEVLGTDLTTPASRFKWFLASILFGARISEKIASNTYREFEKAGVDSPEKILTAGWDELVRVLDEGGYLRYDESTATNLLNIMPDLNERYGSLGDLYEESSDTEDLEKRPQDFKGIGPVTSQIFLRELRGVWDVDPEPSKRGEEAAGYLGIDLLEFEGEMLSRVESALVKLHLRYCKREKCSECPMREFCEKAEGAGGLGV